MPRVRPLRWPWFVTPLAVFVASRAVAVFAAFALRWTPQPQGLRNVLGAWDSGWYMRVALEGYPTTVLTGEGNAAQTPLGFFPLFPLLTRWLAHLTGMDPLVAGLLVNTVTAALAVVLVWKLAEVRWDRAVANRAAVLVAFFPGSYAFSLAYTEGLFMAGAAGCLLLLERKRWWAAAAVAGVASAARPTGYVFALCCAFAVVQHWRRTREWKPLLSPPLALAGFVAHLAYLHVHTGDAFAWQRAQERGWGQRLDFGRTTLRRTFDYVTDPNDDVTLLIGTLMLAVLVALAVVFVRSRPPGVWVVYVVAVAVPALISTGVVYTPRFVLTLFPLLLTAARAMRDTVYGTAVGVSAGLLAIFMVALGNRALTP